MGYYPKERKEYSKIIEIFLKKEMYPFNPEPSKYY